MARKYVSEYTRELDPARWADVVAEVMSDIGDMAAMDFDCRRYAKMYEEIDTLLKPAIVSKMNGGVMPAWGKGEMIWENDFLIVQRVPRPRKGTIDMKALAAEIGIAVVERYRGKDTRYEELQIRLKEPNS